MPPLRVLAALACALGGLASSAWVASARAQVESREGIALQNQMLELRRDVQRLQSQGSQLGGAGPPPVEAPLAAGMGDLNARLLDRVTQLEDEVRRLRGRLDEVDNARQRQGDDLAKQVGDLNFRLDNPGSRGPAAASTTGATPGAETPHRTPETALQQGNAALARHDYAASEAIAREIVAGHGPRQAEGQYLLAQSLAGRRDFQGAAVAYDDSYKRSPHGNRAPDSLLGLATSFMALSQKPEACATLDQLRTGFPKLRADLRPSVAAARQRAGCSA